MPDEAAIGTVAPSSEITAPATTEETPTTTETPESTETPTEETPVETTETESTEETPSEEDALADDVDGRRTDDKTRKEIAQLKKEKPELGKKWAEDHFRRKEFEKVFPGGVREARQSRAAWDAIGGQEGVAKLQDSLANYERADELFAQGDRGLLEELNSMSPEGLNASLRNGLDLISADERRFDEVILPHFNARMEKAGLPQVVDNLMKLVEDGKGPEAFELLGKVKGWLGDIKGKAGKLAETRSKPKDPREDAISKREQELEKRERDSYNQAATADVNKLNHTVNVKVTKKLFDDLKLSPQATRRFLGLLDSEIWGKMEKDTQYMATAKALAKAGDRGKHVQFVHDKYASLLPEVFRTLRNELYPNYKPVTAKPATPANGNGAEKKAAAPAAKPVQGKVYKRSDVDLESTPNVYIINGKAFLKGTQQLVPYS